MSHTERYCRKFLNRENDSEIKEWGSWLRAPSRRAPGPIKSKWLREDGDTDWEQRQGRVNESRKSGKNSYVNPGNQLTKGSISRVKKQAVTTEISPFNGENRNAALQDGNLNSNLDNGLEEDELDGLQILERKRMREGPSS